MENDSPEDTTDNADSRRSAKLRAQIRMRASRMIEENESLTKVRPLVAVFVECDLACERLAAYADEHRGDANAMNQYLQVMGERRHALKLVAPYLPPPPDAESWKDNGDELE